jgi:hypothetical protein
MREIRRTLEDLNGYVTLMRQAGTERERQAYVAAIRRKSARIEMLGAAVVEQCRASWSGTADGNEPAG